jgi:hypothetical protein
MPLDAQVWVDADVFEDAGQPDVGLAVEVLAAVDGELVRPEPLEPGLELIAVATPLDVAVSVVRAGRPGS